MECITTLNEHEGSSLIRDWGIPVIDGMIADNEAEVETAARELGYPVALKVCSSAVMHKTDQGGVTLNICDASSLARSFREIQRRFVGTTHTYLVQKMARPGVELILGARRDPVFGPIVLVGIGGVFTEVFRDTALDLAPLTTKNALSLLRSLKGQALLRGYRSQQPVDLVAAAAALASLSRLVARRTDILEIDINPLITYPQGVVAVDALVRLADQCVVSARRRTAPETVDPFFNPKSFALVGASRSPGKGETSYFAI